MTPFSLLHYRVDHTALTFPCALEPSRSLPLVFEDICVSVNKKVILKDVSGVVRWVHYSRKSFKYDSFLIVYTEVNMICLQQPTISWLHGCCECVMFIPTIKRILFVIEEFTKCWAIALVYLNWLNLLASSYLNYHTTKSK